MGMASSKLKRVPACRPGQGRRLVCGRASGFTLVELLVVISIIAILLGILIPALGIARDTAKNLKCLANLGQLAKGWNSYLAENRGVFPVHVYDNEEADAVLGVVYDYMPMDWGGVHHQSRNNPFVTPERPINPYLSLNDKTEFQFDVFLCPNDDGLTFSGEAFDPNIDSDPYIESSNADESIRHTSFGQYGNSYRANEWIWTRIGSIGGAPFVRGEGLRRGWVGNNKMEWVFRPSDWVMLQGYGSSQILRASEEGRRRWWGLRYSWWHGPERGNAAFLDGSARTIHSHPGSGANEEWVYWLDENYHQPKSWLNPLNATGTPEDKLP